MTNNVLEMRKICKRFAVPVLDNVDFSLRKGEIHALLGGNGAGKSTLMKIMTGVYRADSGDIYIKEKKANIENVYDARNYGIAMIFQELSLVPTMTIAENIFLGRELSDGNFIKKHEMYERSKVLLEAVGIDADPDTKIENLNVGMSQMVEIAKALSQNAEILVMDEPTASLSTHETENLFNIIRKLKDDGVAIVYISHRLSEIFEISDRISVLRDGNLVFSSETEKTDMKQIIAAMVGSSGSSDVSSDDNAKSFSAKSTKNNLNQTILSVKNLHFRDQLKNVNFEINSGEIFGIAGLMGSGRTEIVESLFGLYKDEIDGEILLDGKDAKSGSSREAMNKGFALVPEDRRREGLVLGHSVKENAILPSLIKLSDSYFLNDEKNNDIVDANVDKFNIKTDSINQLISQLSGGNQQKVILAKWLNTMPRILMLDEPTAGVDVGSKEEIINIMREFVAEGNAVIFISSELIELLNACDRIAVLRNGSITKILDRNEINSEKELQYAIQVDS